MKKQITFRSMKHTEVDKDIINDQLEKIESFLSNEREPIYLELILQPSKVHAHHTIELLVKSPHYDLIVKDEGSDFYKLLGNVVDRMYHQLHEKKREFVDSNKQGGGWYKGA